MLRRPEEDPRAGEGPSARRAVLRQGVNLVGLLLVFYAVPLTALEASGRTGVSVALTLAGVASLGWAITGQVTRQLAPDSQTSLQSLVMLLELVVIVFALGYYVLEVMSPGQVAGLDTRTDALYFTLSTLATVGFGDVHAAGQVARALVIVQIVFDVIFVAAIAATVSGRFRSRIRP